MIKIAWEKLQELKHSESRDVKVRFEIGDVTKYTYPVEYFDYIFSRDVILHIGNKRDLLGKVKSWLKPGGQVFITDYTW
jgi:phosphoethanolamine N-methyltransferase